MNREPETGNWLERVAASDAQYQTQLNRIAGADDIDALTAPFDALSEAECDVLVSGVDARLAALDGPQRSSVLPLRGVPSIAMDSPRDVQAHRPTLVAAGLALAAGLLLFISRAPIFGDASTEVEQRDTPAAPLEATLPDYSMRPPHADSEERGGEIARGEDVEANGPPVFTIGRTLEFIFQPSARSDEKPRVWVFDARDSRRSLSPVDVVASDGGGIRVTLPTGVEGFELTPGVTELVFVLGLEVGPAPPPALVRGEALGASGFRRYAFALSWAPPTITAP